MESYTLLSPMPLPSVVVFFWFLFLHHTVSMARAVTSMRRRTAPPTPTTMPAMRPPTPGELKEGEVVSISDDGVDTGNVEDGDNGADARNERETKNNA